MMTRLTVLQLFLLAILMGCASSKPKGTLGEATNAYQSKQYEAAYRLATPLADAPHDRGREAAYIAGLSAEQLGRVDDAERYLLRATRSKDDGLSGDAGVALGLMYSELGRYHGAERALSEAVPKLTGEDRARATYYLAVAQQKLGRTADARTSFTLARSQTKDPKLRALIDRQRDTLGWTVQTGAYRDAKNARTAAVSLSKRVRGASPRMVSAKDARGRTITLVQIGRFTTHDSARRFALKLGDGAVVVPVRK